MKLFRENVKIALGAIRTQSLRTILTVLIIAIGIMALVCILTVVSALEAKVSGDFLTMGSNTFSVTQYDVSDQMDGDRQRVNPIISYTQAREFAEKFHSGQTTTALSFRATGTAEIRHESKKTDPEISVFGVDEHFLINKGLEISDGRNFTPFDIQNNAYVCVIGSDIEKALFPDVSPIDKIISVRGARFRVIGLLKEKGSTFGNNQDLRVLIPIQLARSLFSQPNINYSIDVTVSNKELLDQSVEDAMLLMRQVRRLNPVEENNFGISRSDDLINRILSITLYLEYAAWLIGIITIFGSSIALMNIMLVSVTERTREIGVRKALGAKKRTIATQFFIETLVIGQLGGLAGMTLGILLGLVFAMALDFGFVIPWGAIIAAFVTAFVVAIVSGLYPAVKAARLDPIEALRYE